MNPLEEQIREATRAAAAEVWWGDVPPLPVRSYPERPEAVPRLAVGYWFRRWAAPAAAALAVVAVTGLAAAVGGLAAGRGAAAHASKPVRSQTAHPAAPAYPVNPGSGLIGLFVPASGAQYATGALFAGEYKALEDDIVARCMASYGYRVQAASPAQIAKGDWDLTQFPDLGAIQLAGMLPAYSMPAAPPEPAAYNADLRRCQAVPSPFRAMLQAGERLAAPWLNTLTRIQSSAPVLATLPQLRACAARYGWPNQPYGAPDSAINSFADFVGWVAGHLDGAGSHGSPTAQMDELRRHWATVFVRCARPAVTVMEKLQLTAQQTFLRENQRQFTALIAIARDAFSTAERQAGNQDPR